MLTRIRRDERGVAAPLVALLLVVLLGFSALVVDVGLIYVVRREMQNAVDAAALAAADKLLSDPSSFESPGMRGAISSHAASLAAANGVTGSELEPVVFSYRNPSARFNPTITVGARRNVGLLFASVLGLSSQLVRVEATSIVARMAAFDLWPWGVTQDTIEAAIKAGGNPIALKVGAKDSAVGNFMALDFTEEDRLSGGGASAYSRFILSGFNDPPPIPVPPGPWWVWTETGNMVGPTRDPVMKLLSSPLNCPFGEDIRCPRIAIIPVLKAKTWDDVRGHDQVEVVDFAVFQLTGYDTAGGQGSTTIYGTFKRWAKGVGRVQRFDTDLTGLIGARLWR